MSETVTSLPCAQDIARWAEDIIAGRSLSSPQARSLLDLEPGSEAVAALYAAAQQVRDHFLGNTVHFCSILNAKAGNCSENCSYCSQAAGSTNVDYSKTKWLDAEDIVDAARSAAENGAKALGLVAAWKGVKAGAQLDMICESIRQLVAQGNIRPDVNLGILESQEVANRLQQAGAAVYGHNLETARSFFDQTCSSHSFEERWETIQYIKNSGMGLCSGGIIGMGESKDQRVEFAEQLRFIEPQMIPINFLNPLEGTGYEDRQPVDTDEALITLAMLRLFLPERNIMVAGGKEVTFGERLHEVFAAGVNAVMVGNYLTTLGTDPDYWHKQVANYGLELAGAAGTGCGRGNK
ncbi:MAG: biotin synthase BioB [Planctomycetota bacterium]|nr:MAG: biotin synthase BioB [Planctomycetota bacterium]